MRKFSGGAELGITKECLKEILQDWFARKTISLDDHAVIDIRLSPDAKYVVRIMVEPVAESGAE